MSAGKFERSRYEAEYEIGAIHPIRIQPEALDLVTVGATPVTNAAPTGDITNEISAVVTRSTRALGLKPRSITIQLLDGETPPDGYSEGSITRVPILRPTAYAAMSKNSNVSYLGATWQIVSKNPESVR